MVKAAIFDMDGLMFDTENLYANAWLYAGEVTGFPITRELLESTRGADRESCMRVFNRELGTDFDFYSVRRYRQEYVDTYLNKNGVPLKPGLKELLQFLKESGFRVGLATSTEEATAGKYLDMAGVSRFFDKRVYGNMVKHGKPAPDIYRLAADCLACSPAECLVLEDSILGVRSGAAAGCRVIMIPDGVEPGGQELRMIDHRMESLFDVIDFLKMEQAGNLITGLG